jgi:DNA-binding IclR family transcriptional regulator
VDVSQASGHAGTRDEDNATGERRTVLGAQTLERGLELLELIANEPMTIQEAIRRTGMNRGVVYRLVAALTGTGFLASTSGGRLQGGSKLLQLGQATSASIDIVASASEHLAVLAARTGLSGFLARRDGDYSVHLLRSEGSERIAVTTQPGTRRLLPETGLGKTLLLDDHPDVWDQLFALAAPNVRSADWQAVMRQAQHAGVLLQRGPAPDHINSVCAPVRNASGRIVAAINVAAAAQYLGKDRMTELAPAVAETARAISVDLGGL